MSEYRTPEQFDEIVESFTNGNWSQAARECVMYGFYANDLLEAYDAMSEVYGREPDDTETLRDLILLAEMATEARHKA